MFDVVRLFAMVEPSKRTSQTPEMPYEVKLLPKKTVATIGHWQPLRVPSLGFAAARGAKAWAINP
jgi:hypothetical protein